MLECFLRVIGPMLIVTPTFYCHRRETAGQAEETKPYLRQQTKKNETQALFLLSILPQDEYSLPNLWPHLLQLLTSGFLYPLKWKFFIHFWKMEWCLFSVWSTLQSPRLCYVPWEADLFGRQQHPLTYHWVYPIGNPSKRSGRRKAGREGERIDRWKGERKKSNISVLVP